MGFKKAWALIRLKSDGSVWQLSDTIIKGITHGWTYFAHAEDGRCLMIKRTEFEYISKAECRDITFTYAPKPVEGSKG